MPQYMQEVTQLESSSTEKNLGVVVDFKLNEAAVHLYVRKANGVLSCIRQCGQQVRGDDPATLCSALMRPSLGCCVQFWAALYRRDIELLVRCQQRTSKIIKGMKSLSCE